MRTRVLAVIALLVVPAMLSAQIFRPRRPTVPRPAPLPPTAGPVAQALAIQRSRWSSEAYSLFTTVRVPAGSGVSSYATIGAGTHGGYRFGDRFTGTVDLTTSQFGSPIDNATAEVGARFMPVPFDAELRPFFDLRAAYLTMSDAYAVPGGVEATQDYEVSRYGRGVGAIAGAGFEYSLTNSLALSTEVSALRGRMTAYRTNATAVIPVGSGYTMTSYRLTIGLKFSATRIAQMAQPTR